MSEEEIDYSALQALIEEFLQTCQSSITPEEIENNPFILAIRKALND